MARIYVSSTFADLQDHREAVRTAIRRMGHTDVAMEYYVVEDRRPLDKCLADVRECDLYIVIMAWRYGYTPPGHDHSITHLEYRTALETNKPILAFVLDDKAPWPPNLIEFAQLTQIQSLRTELMTERVAGLFTNKDDLARMVTEGINQWSHDLADRPPTTADWDTYRQAVLDRYRWVVLSVIAGAQHDRLRRIPLLDVYVPPRLRPGRPNFDVATPVSTPVDSTQVLGREPKQVFLGGPGSGKSTMFHAALLSLCSPAAPSSRIPSQLQDLPVPLLIELREYVLRGSPDFVTHLRDVAQDKLGVRLTEEAITALLAQGRAMVFFDGLDEIFRPTTRARVIDQFQAFTNQYPKARVAVSSRIVGYDESSLGLAGFTHYTLLDFGLIEVREFVPRWYEHYTLETDERDAAGLTRRIAENPRLLELAGNPLLLTMMAVIYKHQDLPEKRWQLYARCTDVLLEEWDIKRKKIGRDELGFRIAGDQKAEILQIIAMKMISREAAGSELNAIEYELLRDIIAGYLSDQYGMFAGEARTLAVDLLNHLRERTYILAETGERIFGFVHRTFMEYFAAKQVLGEFNRNKADYAWLTNAIFREHWQDEEWREPLLLLCGMIAGQGSPIRGVVDELATDPIALPFAARCLGEAGQVAPEDRSWATGIAHRLVELGTLPETDDEAIVAFGLLTPFVDVSDETRLLVERLAAADSTVRIFGWQLLLALRSREQRQPFAIEGLRDSDPDVRLAAVAALQREWPGDEGVFQALLDSLRVEHSDDVRRELISALDAGWPRRSEVLVCIDRLTGDPAELSDVSWLVDHLAVAWAGDSFARDIVLRRAGTLLVDPENRAYLRGDVSVALDDGWSQVADTSAYLRQAAEASEDPQVRLTAIRSFVRLDPVAATDWIWDRLESDPLSAEMLRELSGDVADSGHIVKLMMKVVLDRPESPLRVIAESSVRSEMENEISAEVLVRGYAMLHGSQELGRVSRNFLNKLQNKWDPNFDNIVPYLSKEEWVSLNYRDEVPYLRAGVVLAARDLLKHLRSESAGSAQADELARVLAATEEELGLRDGQD